MIPPADPAHFSVLSINLHKGLSPLNRRVIVHGVRLRLHALNPDIVFLQEVQDTHDRHARRHADWPGEAQSAFLAGSLWPEVHYERNAEYRDGHHGNAIFSRFPVDSVSNENISDHRFERRGLLHAVIRIGDRRAHCFCVHLALFERSRRRQIDRILAAIVERVAADEPVIVAGDFNDWRNLVEARFEAAGLVDVFRSGRPAAPRTFPGRLPMFRLDRIYVRGLTVVSTESLKSWSALSDHLAIRATLAL